MRKPSPRRIWKYRKEALMLRGEKCVECGSPDKLSVHHKDGDYKNNEPENTVTLCSSCHLQIHWMEGLYKTPNGINPYIDSNKPKIIRHIGRTNSEGKQKNIRHLRHPDSDEVLIHKLKKLATMCKGMWQYAKN